MGGMLSASRAEEGPGDPDGPACICDLARGRRAQPGQALVREAAAARGAMLPSSGEDAELQRGSAERDLI